MFGIINWSLYTALLVSLLCIQATSSGLTTAPTSNMTKTILHRAGPIFDFTTAPNSNKTTKKPLVRVYEPLFDLTTDPTTNTTTRDALVRALEPSPDVTQAPASNVTTKHAYHRVIEPLFDLGTTSSTPNATKNSLLRVFEHDKFTTATTSKLTTQSLLHRAIIKSDLTTISAANLTTKNLLLRLKENELELTTNLPPNETTKNSLLRIKGVVNPTTVPTRNFTSVNALARVMGVESITTNAAPNGTSKGGLHRAILDGDDTTTIPQNVTQNTLLRVARDVESTAASSTVSTTDIPTKISLIRVAIARVPTAAPSVNITTEKVRKVRILKQPQDVTTVSTSNTTHGIQHRRVIDIEETTSITNATHAGDNDLNRNMPGVTPENENIAENQTTALSNVGGQRKLGTPNSTAAHNTTKANRAAAFKNEKLAEKSKDCDWMTEKERKTVISLNVKGQNLTVNTWFAEFDDDFRRGIARCLEFVFNNRNISFTGDDLAYVKPSPKNVGEDTLQIYVFLRNGKITELEELLKESNNTEGEDRSIQSLMRRGVVEATNLNISKNIYEVAGDSIKNGLPWPDCNSLFTEYLYLWITLIVIVFLLIVGSALLTWYCWRRGKSVELKTHKGISLPTTDELCCTEVVSTISGHDNPALDINGEEQQSPPKKKQAPLPPTPEMSTFGKMTECTEYETAITPYELESPTNGITVEPQPVHPCEGVELQDTKF